MAASARAHTRTLTLLVGWTLCAMAGLAPAAAQTDPAPPGQQNDEIPWSYMRGIAIGDYWSYRITGEQDGFIDNKVAAREDKTSEYFAKTYKTFRIDASGTLDSGELQPIAPTEYALSGSKWVRTNDYATVQVQGHSSYNNQLAQQEGPEAIQAFEPPLVDNVHPFTHGYEWVWAGDVVMNPGNNDDAEGSAAKYGRQFAVVEGRESATVPAGTFDAWRLNYTSVVSSGAYTIRWHSDTVCDLVREESYDKSHQLKHRLELVDFSCTGAEVDQPRYDTKAVTLLSRGIAGGATGAIAPTPSAEEQSGQSPGLGWTASLFVVALLVAAVTRRKRIT